MLYRIPGFLFYGRKLIGVSSISNSVPSISASLLRYRIHMSLVSVRSTPYFKYGPCSLNLLHENNYRTRDARPVPVLEGQRENQDGVCQGKRVGARHFLLLDK